MDRKRGQRKGATSKKRQKVSIIFSTLFDIFGAGQKTSKIVKKCQKYIFSTLSTVFARRQFSGPFGGALVWARDSLGGILGDNLARVIASQELSRDSGGRQFLPRDIKS